MISLRKESYLAPSDEAEADGFRPTARKTRVTRHTSRIDTIADRAMWGGIALVTTLTASLTAWSAAELLASPYDSDPWSPVWTLGLGLGLVADTLWIIMLLLVRRARAMLRTNPQAEQAGWGFAAVSVIIIAGHALVDGADIRSWGDFTLWTVILLVFAVFPVLTKLLWTVLLNSFYHAPDPELATQLDEEARLLAADRLRLVAEGEIKRERQLLTAERRQLDKELGLADEESAGRPQVELTRDQRDTRQDTGTGKQDTTPRQDAATTSVLPVPSRDTQQDTTRRRDLDTITDRTALPSSPAAVTPAAAQNDPQKPTTSGRTGQPSVRDTILTALREGVSEDDDETLSARVAEAHGEVKRGSYRKSRSRAIEAHRTTAGEGFYP